MAESRSHKVAANRIAKRLRTDYNSGKGVDIVTPTRAVEVETPSTVKDGVSQLRGFRKPVYVAGSNQEATQRALDITQGTTVGVMDSKGNIVKRSTRKR